MSEKPLLRPTAAIANLQGVLHTMGLYDGVLNGRMTPQFEAAVTRLQQGMIDGGHRHAPATGIYDQQTMHELNTAPNALRVAISGGRAGSMRAPAPALTVDEPDAYTQPVLAKATLLWPNENTVGEHRAEKATGAPATNPPQPTDASPIYKKAVTSNPVVSSETAFATMVETNPAAPHIDLPPEALRPEAKTSIFGMRLNLPLVRTPREWADRAVRLVQEDMKITGIDTQVASPFNKMAVPTNGFNATRSYGTHRALDSDVPGEPEGAGTIKIFAPIGGRIAILDREGRMVPNGNGGFEHGKGAEGQYLAIAGDDNRSHGLMHFAMLDKDLKLGKRIEKGQFIGIEGSTGSATRDHLHWQVFRTVNPNPTRFSDYDTRVDPMELLRANGLMTAHNEIRPNPQAGKVQLAGHDAPQYVSRDPYVQVVYNPAWTANTSAAMQRISYDPGHMGPMPGEPLSAPPKPAAPPLLSGATTVKPGATIS